MTEPNDGKTPHNPRWTCSGPGRFEIIAIDQAEGWHDAGTLDPDHGIEVNTDIRCACGAPTNTSVANNTTVYTCSECGQWVATMRYETAPGATIFGEAMDQP